MRFQGGFTPKNILIEKEGKIVQTFHPADCNSGETFILSERLSVSPDEKLRILMPGGSTDFYGRIVVYNMKVSGNVVQ